MARLYKYVDSAEKSGFFLSGRKNGCNTTIQVRPLGDRLFKRLDYKAGRQTPSGNRGEKLPRELVGWMWNVRLLYTESEEDGTNTSLQNVLDFGGETVELSESDIQDLVEFVQGHDAGADGDLRGELVDILGVDSVDDHQQDTAGTQSDDQPQKEPHPGARNSTTDSRGLSQDEHGELLGHLSNAIDGSEHEYGLVSELSRVNDERDWLWSVRHLMNDSDAFVHGANVGSEGDPVYNMQTGDIQWDLYDRRRSERSAADFLVVINPLSGHSPKQSFGVDESGIIDWKSYEDYLGIRQVRELIKVVPSVERTLRSVPGFKCGDLSNFPEPDAHAMLNTQRVVNNALQASHEPFDNEPGRTQIWGEVIDVSPKGWIEIRLQTNRAVVIPVKRFPDEPSVNDWVLLEPKGHSEWPTEFDVVTVG